MPDSQNIIHTLSSSTINQIAAGEVVQRPSSVVKELMENAIDAGATKIDVIIQDAGRTLIQVIDNGKGMSPDDSVKAFERHATSKISDAEDLFALRTMGFRGEALASIAAVSRVELKTRRPSDELGSRVEINGGELASQEFITCQAGTQVLVKDLFYNIPVRRKFLKKNETELRNILNIFEQIALVYPGISFTLTNNGSTIFNLCKENYRQRISSVCGDKTGKELLSIDVDTVLAHISGFISTPDSSVKKSPSQYFFVNGRYIQHPYFAKAVAMGYDKYIPAESKPQFFIYFDIEPDKIDVNIHPTKTEVKFEDEQSIFPIIISAVKEALASSGSMPGLMFDQEDRIEIPVAPVDFSGLQTPPVTRNTTYNPFSSHIAAPSGTSKPVTGWESLYEGVSKEESTLKSSDKPAEYGIFESAKPQFIGFVYGGKYIVCATESGIMLVNGYRASLRIAYDRLSGMIESGHGAGQMLLFPEIVELTATENVTFIENKPLFESVGYGFEDFGPNAYKITAVPVTLAGDYIASIKELLSDPDACNVQESFKERLLNLLAKRSVHTDVVRSVEEAERVVTELFKTSLPQATPQGLPILFVLDAEALKNKIG